jgi:hypothetical protein
MRRLALLVVLVLLAPLAGRADDLLTPTQIRTMEQRGWITPEFEAASRELLDAQDSAKKATDDQARLDADMPALQNKTSAEDAKVAALKAELARYAHPEETDFVALQKVMHDSSAPLQDQMAVAQAYVWTYPGNPHTAEAESDLQQLEKKIADQTQAEKDAAAAQEAAQLKLLQRVKARDLSLAEWRAFLQDKSQEEVRQYLGAPTSQSDDYWTYTGAWTLDPSSGLKAGLQLTFNGTRVQNVSPVPAQ